MDSKYKIKKWFSALCVVLFSTVGFSQTGNIIINENDNISQLLELKKQISENQNRYKIQIFSGDRASAERADEKFQETFNSLSSRLVYETPNYKLWVGSFRSRLEADRALIKIKNKFPSAFIFKPKK